MTKAERQKARERRFVDHFLEATGTPAAVVDFDRPDFLLKQEGAVTGLEVVECLPDAGPRGSVRRQAEKARQDYLRAVAKRYYDTGGRPILVHLLLGGLPTPQLVDTAVRRLKSARPSKVMDQRRTYLIADHEKVGTLYVTSLPGDFPRYSRWQCVTDSGGLVGCLRAADLERVIRHKAGKLDSYRKNASTQDIRLLIVVNRTVASGLFNVDPTALNQSTRGFSRVHVLLYPQACYEVS